MQLPELMAVQGDVMLRALRFMDSMIQRDTMQKAAFLSDLTTFWHKFDDRVLRLKVLFANAACKFAVCMALVFCALCSLVLQISHIVDKAIMQVPHRDLVLPLIYWYLADQAACADVVICANTNKAMLQVLPHLLEAVRSEQLQQLVLPLVIHILGKQDKQVIHSVQHA